MPDHWPICLLHMFTILLIPCYNRHISDKVQSALRHDFQMNSFISLSARFGPFHNRYCIKQRWYPPQPILYKKYIKQIPPVKCVQRKSFKRYSLAFSSRPIFCLWKMCFKFNDFILKSPYQRILLWNLNVWIAWGFLRWNKKT